MKYLANGGEIKLNRDEMTAGSLEENMCFDRMKCQLSLSKFLAIPGQSQSHTLATNSSPARDRISAASHSQSSNYHALNDLTMGPRQLCRIVATRIFLKFVTQIHGKFMTLIQIGVGSMRGR